MSQVEAVLGAELEDGALVVGGNGVKPSTVLGGKVLGVLLALKYTTTTFSAASLSVISPLEQPPPREDDLDVRVLVRPVFKCFKAPKDHGSEIQRKGGGSRGSWHFATMFILVYI